jgi:hypothetical protein
VTKDGLYNITTFKGSTLICTIEQFISCSINDKGNLVIEFLNNENQNTSVCIKNKFSEEDANSINQFLIELNQEKIINIGKIF